MLILRFYLYYFFKCVFNFIFFEKEPPKQLTEISKLFSLSTCLCKHCKIEIVNLFDKNLYTIINNCVLLKDRALKVRSTAGVDSLNYFEKEFSSK